MQVGFITIGALAGGLGLFLLAMHLITDGLKVAAGRALHDLLGKWTRSPARGIVAGFTITAIVQSSSAVTVAIIGFVNAGLLTLYQALGVVFGANVGTSVTGWLVAIVGFKIKIETFALPLIGVGMLLRLTGGDSRRAPMGMVLAGFGLFFIGLDVLMTAFDGLASLIDLQQFTMSGISGVFLYLGIGFIMTVLTQSSSAAIALTLTAASSGVLGMHAAAAMVIGANIGTTSTAAIAVIGATPNAKRVGAAHVIFNVLTGIVALLILPLLFMLIDAAGALLKLEGAPAVTLALFHTSFNVLGVLLMWPFSNRLSRFLERRFVSLEEAEGRPRFLDKTVVVSPTLALNALTLEMTRIAAVTRRIALAALSAESGVGKRVESDHVVVEKLSNEVSGFIALLERSLLTEDVTNQLAKVLRAEQHLMICTEQALLIARTQAKLKILDDARLAGHIGTFRSQVVQLMVLTDLEIAGFSFTACEAQLEQVQVSYDDTNAVLIKAGTRLNAPVPEVIAILEQNSNIRRMAREMFKATHYLSELYTVGAVLISETETPDSEKGESKAIQETTSGN